MMNGIHTAVPHEQHGDLEEPLVSTRTDEKVDANVDRTPKDLSRYSLCLGILLGLWFQVVSLGATALLASVFGILSQVCLPRPRFPQSWEREVDIVSSLSPILNNFLQ